jgi:hypothetical protein
MKGSNMRPGYETLRMLRAGKVVELDGLLFSKDNGDLNIGDTYIGARNTVDVYTCKGFGPGREWVIPEGIGYCFDLQDCVKVRLAYLAITADYVVPQSLTSA